MRYVYDIFEGTFSTGDAREIELGKRVMAADDWENGDSRPPGRTDYKREQAEAFIAGNAARAENEPRSGAGGAAQRGMRPPLRHPGIRQYHDHRPLPVR